jgi:hypothetical protein
MLLDDREKKSRSNLLKKFSIFCKLIGRSILSWWGGAAILTGIFLGTLVIVPPDFSGYFSKQEYIYEREPLPTGVLNQLRVVCENVSIEYDPVNELLSKAILYFRLENGSPQTVLIRGNGESSKQVEGEHPLHIRTRLWDAKSLVYLKDANLVYPSDRDLTLEPGETHVGHLTISNLRFKEEKGLTDLFLEFNAVQEKISWAQPNKFCRLKIPD